MQTGQTIGPYTIDREIGRGGMGVVFLAKDTRLDRLVAVKALPENLGQDPDRLARFDREAKTLATLSHPNVAAVHAVEVADDHRYLILEYVEGPTLADRLEQGPLPIDDALELTIQIATGIEAAHDAGVVHRDLKPANIKITPEGTAKILDFGLAKATDPEPNSSISSSLLGTVATLSTPHSPTVAGAILGTAPYMSPEQARGKHIDKRTDIWAFAVILYECLTGLGPFRGETISDSIGAILHKDVDLNLLPPNTPLQIRKVLERCLERDRNKRLRDIGDARIELEDALKNPHAPTGAHAAARPRTTPLVVVALIAAAIGSIIGATAMLLSRPTPEPPPLVRAAITPPPGAGFQLEGVGPAPVALAPDGARLVFGARDESGVSLLWIRDLDDPTPRPIAGTDNAQYPFWSPDSKHIAFIAEGALKRVPADGGPVVTIADADNGKGGAWSTDDTILFAPNAVSPIFRVPASGGTPTQVTTIEPETHDSHRHPRFLPDANHFVYLARKPNAVTSLHDVILSSLDDPETTTTLTASATSVEIAEDHLLFMVADALMIQPFDLADRSLTGTPTALIDNVMSLPGAVLGVFSVSNNATLAYQPGTALIPPSSLTWFDRQGTKIGVLDNSSVALSCHLSPDGNLAAACLIDNQRGTGDIWIYDVPNDTRTRLTFDPAHDGVPTFTPDSSHVYYGSVRGGSFALYAAPVQGFEAERLIFAPDFNVFSTSWSPDATQLALVCPDQEHTIQILNANTAEATPLDLGPGQHTSVQFSPDARFIAYSSDASGVWEIYVAPYPQLSRKWPVSRDGGSWPRWSAKGDEIFFHAPNGQLMAAPFHATESTADIGVPTPLFDLRQAPGINRVFDVTPDAQRFLVRESVPQEFVEPLTLVLNWPRLLNPPN